MAEKTMPSLDGLIQTKGAARPDAIAQRVEAQSPARVLQATLHAVVPSHGHEKEPRAKSLTLRLSEPQYERLRRFAFERRLSHQDIIERAVMMYTEGEGA